ncbi:hypothetical protein [Streptomyces sp. Je 1-332]|uniref:hypothetical protein n=1 Tax=Streptomyces sp. Je 1-332 TaxID=3231270 RepID=UPI0034594CCC
MKWKSVAGTAFGFAVSAVFCLSGTAAASDDTAEQGARVGPPVGAPCSQGRGTHACFEKSGDKFWVKDTGKDGWFPRVYWTYKGSELVWEGSCSDHLGSDAGWTSCSFADEIAENKTIYFQAFNMVSDNVEAPEMQGPGVYAKTS